VITSAPRIIAAFAGVGKTTLAKKSPQAMVDFTCMPFKYHLPNQLDSECEAYKANPDYEMRDEWPDNYIEAIKEALCSDKTIIIPSDTMVLFRLSLENIPYFLCYPQREAKEVYRQRFIDRGNTENFIDIFIGRWDLFMDSLESDTYGRHIVMKPHQFLSDVVDKFRN
jgi:hypothetical protein